MYQNIHYHEWNSGKVKFIGSYENINSILLNKNLNDFIYNWFIYWI
jgi:hypothetical protein